MIRAPCAQALPALKWLRGPLPEPENNGVQKSPPQRMALRDGTAACCREPAFGRARAPRWPCARLRGGVSSGRWWGAGWGGTGGGPPSAYCHTTNQPTAGRLTATEVCCSSPFCPRLGSFHSLWARRGPSSEGEALAVPAGPGASPHGRPPARGCHEAWSAEPLCVPMASKREKVDAGLWNSPGVTFVGSEGHTESQPARV